MLSATLGFWEECSPCLPWSLEPSEDDKNPCLTVQLLFLRVPIHSYESLQVPGKYCSFNCFSKLLKL